SVPQDSINPTGPLVDADSYGFALTGLAGECEVLLGTAVLQAKDSQGKFTTVRAVTDSGSQMSFITTDCARRLGIR
ncbi:hypothetical protein, partial [Klebsiella pneumoniae]|uniref:hypothetical protein n=1 Tax=Klebsiella pneumoniae TaxID=573 RepID=UPI0040555AFD